MPFKVHSENSEEGDHPWGIFLEARKDVIIWMSQDMKRSDNKIAFDLSMDEAQVTAIRKSCNI